MSLPSWVEPILDLFLPPACAGCGSHLPARRGMRRNRICARCLSRLPVPPHPRCPRCDAPRGTGLPADRACSLCAEWPPILRYARASTLLGDPADALVHALKYGGWAELGSEMGGRMARLELSLIEEGRTRVVVPIPTTQGRLRARGYNQAEILARAVALEWETSLLDALVRREGGESQVALHPDERRANVQGAFLPRVGVAEQLRNREVILVDDVLTTGATACAAAEVLGAAGARSVILLTFARALPEG